MYGDEEPITLRSLATRKSSLNQSATPQLRHPHLDTSATTSTSGHALNERPETILEEAQRLVHGPRGSAYGHPIDDYTCTGKIWGALLDKWLHSIGAIPADTHVPDIDPRICAIMMVGVKISREANKHKRDNLTDIAGYAECAQMIADVQNNVAGRDVEPFSIG